MPAAALDASAPGTLFSSTVTRAPACASFHAQADPMTPPPTIRTSEISARFGRGDDGAQGTPRTLPYPCSLASRRPEQMHEAPRVERRKGEEQRRERHRPTGGGGGLPVNQEPSVARWRVTERSLDRLRDGGVPQAGSVERSEPPDERVWCDVSLGLEPGRDPELDPQARVSIGLNEPIPVRVERPPGLASVDLEGPG